MTILKINPYYGFESGTINTGIVKPTVSTLFYPVSIVYIYIIIYKSEMHIFFFFNKQKSTIHCCDYWVLASLKMLYMNKNVDLC